MLEEELKILNEDFKQKSKDLYERYMSNPLRDGYISEDVELRHWYESELRKIYKINKQQS